MSYLGQGLGLGREERFTATATAGQTTVTVGNDGRSISYTPNYVDVYLNGVKMVNGSDVTVTSGTSIVFASALSAGDSVDVVAPGYFQPADTVSRSLGGTFLGPVNLPSGGLNVGSGQLQVDSSGRVRMGSQPSMKVYTTGQVISASGWAKFPGFGSVVFNDGGNWNSGTQRFTAPVSGRYLFSVGGWTSGSVNGERYAYSFAVNGSYISFISGGNYCVTDSPMSGFTDTLKLNAGDYVELYYYSAQVCTWGGGSHTFHMSANLLG